MIKLSMKGKLVASLGCICAILFISCLISFIEYTRVSSYVSDLIEANIGGVDATRKLTSSVNKYNVDVLAVVGDEDLYTLPDFDAPSFISRCDSLKASFEDIRISTYADSVKYAFASYMLTCLELPKLLQNDDLNDERNWYIDRLRPRYLILQRHITKMSEALYDNLNENSQAFDSVFYRSIIPGIVAVGAGMLLTILLLFYLLQYYANPLGKMNRSLKLFRSLSKKYSCQIESDDCLAEINDSIEAITQENSQLRQRVADLRGSDKKAKQ